MPLADSSARRARRAARRLARWAGLVLAVAAAGCAALAPPEASPEPGGPEWTVEPLVEHLRVFNASLDERATGTQGYARTAAYVADRMGEAGLQPALGDNFRVLYRTALNYPAASLMASLGTDSLAFIAGVDHLPDAYSDSGRVRTAEVFVDLHAAADSALDGRVVLVPAEAATPAYLRGVRAAGAAAVLLVGPLRPHQAAAPVPGLLVVQATYDAAGRLIGRPAVFARDAAGPRRLPRTVVLRVAAEYQPSATAINTLGFVAGRHPVRARDLVIVCADLDGAPAYAGARTLDFQHFGQGAAALLEAAAHTTYYAAHTSIPERSMLFAVWSGARIGGAGLQAYLEQPLWPLEATRAVVYVGLRPEDEPAVRAQLAAHGLPLYVVPPPPPVAEAPVALIPQSETRRVSERRPRRGDRTPGINLSEHIERAAADALALARATLDLALPLTITPAPFAPVADTLVVPSAVGPTF